MDFDQRINGYQRRIAYEWNQWRNAKVTRKRKRTFDHWLDHLATDPPDVLVGANFAAYGGVRHHIQAIQRYSSMNVALAPSEKVMQVVGAHHVTHDFREKFSSFPAKGIKVVHSHVFPWFIEWCHQRQKEGMRWVHTYHLNYYPEHGTGTLELWQEEINTALLEVACHADVRLSVSKWQAEELLREHGIETQYLPNGVDVAMCDAADASRFFKRTAMRNFILWVGRNDPVKNPVEFVRLAERLPEYEFVMIGGGLSNAALQADWQIDVPRNLHVIGPLSQAEVQDAIAACSVLVVTSKREGLPTIVMESMVQKKTVVVPNEAGCMEVVGHCDAGVIYALGNLDDLVDKTLEAMVDKARGHRARKRVLSEYDWRVILPKLDAYYTEMFKERL